MKIKVSDKYIPINKGNYSMETPEREALFEQYRSEGWENEYNEYRLNWTRYAQNQIVSEYPLLIDIELSSLCNLKCPMCYTITEEFKSKVKTQLMDMKLFHKIIDEISGKVPAVRLSLRGEATLHPDFIECIAYCKKNGIGEVSFLTNCSKFSKEYFEKVMLAGADWITISVDGTDQTYESIRMPLKFDETLSKIKDMKSAKANANRHKPVIKVQSIWPAIKNNPTEFYNTFKPYVDLVAFNPLIDYLGNDHYIVYTDNFSCPQLYQRLVVGSDGTVMMCSNDEDSSYPIGNAHDQSIYEIWHGDKLNDVRELHKQKDGFKNIAVCRKCYLPRATEDNEIAIIDEREVIIKNYINRKQKIGC